MQSPEKTLNAQAAAAVLEVSEATVRNWAKLGLLPVRSLRPLAFSPTAVENLKCAIAGGQVPKLRRRANKNGGAAAMEPELERRVFSAAMSKLFDRGEWSGEGFKRDSFRRKNVWMVAAEWLERGAAFDPDESSRDPAALFQQLSNPGNRACSGAFYTPPELAFKAVSAAAPPAAPANFLDPCCGAGAYLLAAARRFPELPPERIHGVDISPVACLIAKLELLSAFPEREFTPQIANADALANFPFAQKFDLICTNPPWGARKNSQEESFELFARLCFRKLATGGRLSLLLPESFLTVERFAGLRRDAERLLTVDGITKLGRPFREVATNIVRLDATNGGGSGRSVRLILQTDGERELLNRLFACRRTVTLKGRAKWAMGVVTGDNAAMLSSSPLPGALPVLRGRDLHKYRRPEPSAYLKRGRYQQMAPEGMYRATEKLVYRFIAASPVVVYDDRGLFTLNSANILIPRLDELSIFQVAALLNSEVLRLAYRAMFKSGKVLRSHLEQLPLAVPSSPEERRRFEVLSQQAIRGCAEPPELEGFIRKLYEL